ncbi:response regulator [Thauera sp. CAU 1555]|uniref:Response regulator n=1 Tax=Thauera sedimentorum TaxID=2767595 RepID=A0ABR9B9G1_9RHOO|nr:response regulator [Thauera sedimentorum]MBC9070927.1 response regulator [Thauera sedimentorum]MBD8501846.1 response regulator [Thauera sedimentorum]
MKRVLIVDDNQINRRLAAALLKKCGWHTEEADSGMAAFERLTEARFDCVLLDISMPGMDGEEVCRRIRADEALANLRVIAYTAHAMEFEKARIMQAGFDDILVKPVTINALTAVFSD